MTGIVFTPAENTPGKKDYTGAFRPEARAFAKAHGIPENAIHAIPKERRADMRTRVYDALVDHAPYERYDHVAFFCHGYPNGIQLGYDIKSVGKLAEAIADTSKPDVTVALYCCSTADSRQKKSIGGDGGFADLLRDGLCWLGCTDVKVIAHVTVGHTTRNPHVRFFYGNGSSVGGTGGMYVVSPDGPLWRPWVKWLKRGDNRFRFPYMERDEIVSALA